MKMENCGVYSSNKMVLIQIGVVVINRVEDNFQICINNYRVQDEDKMVDNNQIVICKKVNPSSTNNFDDVGVHYYGFIKNQKIEHS